MLSLSINFRLSLSVSLLLSLSLSHAPPLSPSTSLLPTNTTKTKNQKTNKPTKQTRQTLHLDPSFVSTPNARNEAMLAEAAAFAVALKRCEKDIRGAKAAAEALMGTAGAVLSSPLPRVFEDLGGGRAAPAPPGPGGAGTIGGGDFSAEDLDAVSKDSSKKLEAEVLAPMARWAAAFAAVSARMKRLEGVRLEVDSRRRTVVALGCKIDRQRLRLPQTRSKGEWAMEQSIKAMQHKEHKLAAARGAFREQEALVFAQLAQLIRDAVWLKSYLAAVMRLQQESYGAAAGSLGPAKAALGASVAMSERVWSRTVWAYTAGCPQTASVAITTWYPRLTASIASPSTPRLTLTPVTTRTETPMFRRVASSAVPEKGETPWRRGMTRSLGSGPSSAMSSVAAVPSRRCSGRRSTAECSGVVMVVPARSARNSAVQCTTGSSRSRACLASRPALAGRPTCRADSSRAGKEARSPITPRWSSMVTMATGGVAGRPRPCSEPARTSTRSTGMSACGGLGLHDVGGPSVVGLA